MDTETVLGIAFGLGAALCHSLSYLFSRQAVAGSEREATDRFIASHLLMGLLVLPFLPAALQFELPPVRELALGVAGMVGFYLVGQRAFFILNRYVSPSLSSPLLGFKILVVTALTLVLLRRPVPPLQWVAGGIAVAATYTLNRSAGRLPVKALIWLVAACCGYALSDTSIAHVVGKLRASGPLAAPLIAVCLCYILIGIMAAATSVARRTPIQRPHASTLGFAIFWMGAMVCLFISIALVGPVTAVILQAMRGLFSFILALSLPKLGLSNGEAAHAPPTPLRLAGALMMVLAAALAAIA
jgi:drug/metabolite transporter (DMT)-like permease